MDELPHDSPALLVSFFRRLVNAGRDVRDVRLGRNIVDENRANAQARNRELEKVNKLSAISSARISLDEAAKGLRVIDP